MLFDIWTSIGIINIATQILESIFKKSIEYCKHKNYSAASKVLEELVKLFPNSSAAWYLQGLIATEVDEPSLAIEKFKKAAKLHACELLKNNNLDHFLCSLSLSLKEVGYEKESNVILNRGLEAAKAKSASSKSWIYRNIKRGREITEAGIIVGYKPLFKNPKLFFILNKNESNFEEYLYWHERGNSCRNCGLYKVATMNYCRSIECQPNFYKAFYNIARCYAALDNSAAALKSLKSAINLNSNECCQKAMKDPAFSNMFEDKSFQELLAH